ncbi:SpoIIE family protein phosphatase [Azospirillum halopraeferens]|uniref:SpoIIE family protein phosphatase n=1 Tax=Azospirillum halopraeferens TaxID=34010 RepID=UPI0004194AC9|nr:SpoIIE family protein phosphatase [Azospirillum halopraeferens]
MAQTRPVVARRLIAGLLGLAVLTVAAVAVAVYGAAEFRRGFDHIALTRTGHLVAFSKLAQQSQIVAASAPRLVASADGFELERQVRSTGDLFALLDEAFAELEASGADAAAVAALAGYRPLLAESLDRIADLVAQRHAAEQALLDSVVRLGTTARDLRRVEALTGAALTGAAGEGELETAVARLDSLRSFTATVNLAIDRMLPVAVVPIAAALAPMEADVRVLLEQGRGTLRELPPAHAHSLLAVLDTVAALAEGPESVFALRHRQIDIAARTRGLLAQNAVVAGRFVATVSRTFTDLQGAIAAERRDFGVFIATAYRGLLAIGGVAVLAALLVVLYVRGRVIGRLLELKRCMTANAGGAAVPVPVEGDDEIADMGRAFRHFVDAVAAREAALAAKSRDLEAALASVDEGTRYARRIQRSLLPPADAHGGLLRDVAVVWQPLDVVGGDCYWIGAVDGRCVVALMDCTGHGVPGAVMTAIASSAFTRILQDHGQHDPAVILERMDAMVRAALRQDAADDDAESSDDGLDAAVCIIDPAAGRLSFAGANLPLLYHADGALHLIRGTRASLGYRRGARAGAHFVRHDLPLRPDLRVYLHTDGVTDHVGGPKRLLFGRRRLQEVLEGAAGLSMAAVASRLLDTLDTYRGGEPRRDDVTFIAFAPTAAGAPVEAAAERAEAEPAG